MRLAPIAASFLVASLTVAGSQASAVMLGQVDDFQSLTTEGWIVGIGDENPSNFATGGPAGDGDAYVQYTSFGGGGPFSRMIFYNTSQWTGDYLAAGVTGLTADVINTGSTPLELRLAFGDNRSARNGSWFASTESVSLAPGSGWQSVFLPIDPGSLTQVLGTGTYADLMTDVGALRVLSSVSPSNLGDLIEGVVGVDNLRAVPEPTGFALAALAILAAGRRQS